jgi:hypothetical protein
LANVYTGASDRWHDDYERGRPGWPPKVVDIPGLPPAATVHAAGSAGLNLIHAYQGAGS